MQNNKIHVVAVDDEEDVKLLYTHFFEDEIESGELELSFMTSPLECMKILSGMSGNVVVVSDINMPEMTGFELIEKIKSLDKGIKVLMVSAYNTSEYIDKSLALGAEDFLVKPINFLDLKQKILELF